MPIDIGIALNANKSIIEYTNKIVDLISTKANIEKAITEISTPHITLFQGRFPKEHFDNIILETTSICKSIPPFTVSFSNKLFFRENGNVFWNAINDNRLRECHNVFQSTLYPLTQGLLLDQFRNILESVNTSETVRRSISRYGIVSAGDLFMPHITLCKLVFQDDEKTLSELRLSDKAFLASSVIVGTIDKLGRFSEISTIIRLGAEEQLQPNKSPIG